MILVKCLILWILSLCPNHTKDILEKISIPLYFRKKDDLLIISEFSATFKPPNSLQERKTKFKTMMIIPCLKKTILEVYIINCINYIALQKIVNINHLILFFAAKSLILIQKVFSIQKVF